MGLLSFVGTLSCQADSETADTSSARPVVVTEARNALLVIEDTLRPTRLLGDTSSFGWPVQLQVVGDRLVVADAYMSPHLIVVDRQSGQVTARFGRTGSGPGEIRAPWFMLAETVNRPSVWLFDIQIGRLTRFSLESDTGTQVLQSIQQRQAGMIEQLIPTATGLIAGGSLRDASLLLLDSSTAAVRQRTGTPPFSWNEYRSAEQLNRYWLTVNPSRTIVTLAYRHLSRLDFYTADGDLIRSTMGPRVAPLPQPEGQDRLPITHDAGITASDRYVYVNYCDDCREGYWPLGVKPRLVHIYTLNGEFVAELMFDRQLSCIAVTADDSLLYAGVFEPHPMIAEWNLPAFLRRGETMQERR